MKKSYLLAICSLFLLSFFLSLVFFDRLSIKKMDIYFLDSPQKEEEKKDVELQTDDYDEGVSQGYLVFLVVFLTAQVIDTVKSIIFKDFSGNCCYSSFCIFFYICILFFFIIFLLSFFLKNEKSFSFHLKNVYFFRSQKRTVLLVITLISVIPFSFLKSFMAKKSVDDAAVDDAFKSNNNEMDNNNNMMEMMNGLNGMSI